MEYLYKKTVLLLVVSLLLSGCSSSSKTYSKFLKKETFIAEDEDRVKDFRISEELLVDKNGRSILLLNIEKMIEKPQYEVETHVMITEKYTPGKVFQGHWLKTIFVAPVMIYGAPIVLFLGTIIGPGFMDTVKVVYIGKTKESTENFKKEKKATGRFFVPGKLDPYSQSGVIININGSGNLELQTDNRGRLRLNLADLASKISPSEGNLVLNARFQEDGVKGGWSYKTDLAPLMD